MGALIMLCGQCGKQNCECPPPVALAAPIRADLPHGMGELMRSAISLPDILECAIFGQQYRKRGD